MSEVRRNAESFGVSSNFTHMILVVQEKISSEKRINLIEWPIYMYQFLLKETHGVPTP